MFFFFWQSNRVGDSGQALTAEVLPVNPPGHEVLSSKLLPRPAVSHLLARGIPGTRTSASGLSVLWHSFDLTVLM